MVTCEGIDWNPNYPSKHGMMLGQTGSPRWKPRRQGEHADSTQRGPKAVIQIKSLHAVWQSILVF